MNIEPRFIKKVVINTKKGGKFELSQQAINWLARKAPSVDPTCWMDCNYYRTHPLLVECVLSLGKRASTANSAINCVDIKKGVRFLIQENNGAESVLFPNEIKWQRMWSW